MNEPLNFDEWEFADEETCEICGDLCPCILSTVTEEEDDEIEYDEKMVCKSCHDGLGE